MTPPTRSLCPTKESGSVFRLWAVFLLDRQMPQGRIVLKRICQSRKIAALKTDGARLLYTWLIPNVDINGCFSGDADVLKGQIFTRLKKSIKSINSYLTDLEEVGLIIWYESDGDKYLQIPDFVEKQPSLNPNKEAKTTIPLPTPELIQTLSSVYPPQSKVKQSKVKQSKEKVKYLDFVFLTPDEHKKLLTRYGEIPTGKLIDSLNRYIGQSGKKYDSHYFALLNFAKRDDVRELPTSDGGAASEQKDLEKRKQQIRDLEDEYYRSQSPETLQTWLTDKEHIHRRWLIKETMSVTDN